MALPASQIEVTKIADFSPHIKMLVYGDYGAGKTVFSATAPNCVIIDVENGTLSLKNHPELADALVIPGVKTWGQLLRCIEMVSKKEGVLANVETVVVDSVSELQQRIMDDQLKTKGRLQKQDVFIAEGKDYQENTERMRRFALFMKDLPLNFILTAHTKIEEKDGIVTGIRPNLTPKFNSTVMGQMDVVGYMRRLTRKVLNDDDKEVEEVYRAMQVHPTARVMAKSRLALPAVIIDPTWADISASNKEATSV